MHAEIVSDIQEKMILKRLATKGVRYSNCRIAFFILNSRIVQVYLC